jgi:uncharacterized membrane protein HdeD (DUF308 family)
MATGGASSPLGIGAIILIIIGIIMAVVGIILLLAAKNKPKSWYIWFMLIAGFILGVIGGILLAIALAEKCKPFAELETTEPAIKTTKKSVVTIEKE